MFTNFYYQDLHSHSFYSANKTANYCNMGAPVCFHCGYPHPNKSISILPRENQCSCLWNEFWAHSGAEHKYKNLFLWRSEAQIAMDKNTNKKKGKIRQNHIIYLQRQHRIFMSYEECFKPSVFLNIRLC